MPKLFKAPAPSCRLGALGALLLFALLAPRRSHGEIGVQLGEGEWSEADPSSTSDSHPACDCTECEPWFYAWGRGGGEYINVPGDSKFAGTYGASIAVNLNGRVGFLGSIDANHFSRGSQLLGTIGIIKPADFCNCDPWSFSVLFDQFSDSRVFNNLYISRLRYQLGYALRQDLEVGVAWADPLNGDDTFLIVRNLGNLVVPGRFTAVDIIDGYFVKRCGDTVVGGRLGYRELPDTWFAGVSLQTPVNDLARLYVNLDYEATNGRWWGGVGLSIPLGRRSRGGYSPTPADRLATGSANDADLRGGESRLVSYVPRGNPPPNNPAGAPNPSANINRPVQPDDDFPFMQPEFFPLSPTASWRERVPFLYSILDAPTPGRFWAQSAVFTDVPLPFDAEVFEEGTGRQIGFFPSF